MKNVFLCLAVAGGVAALIVHLLALTGYDFNGKMFYVMALFPLVFVVWLPAILRMRNDPAYREYRNPDYRRRLDLAPFYRMIGKGKPMWLGILAAGMFFYATVNFFLAMHALGDKTIIRGINDGTPTARAFSGHYLAFFAIAIFLLYPKKEDANEGDRH